MQVYYTEGEGETPSKKIIFWYKFEKENNPSCYCTHVVFCHVCLGSYLCSTNHVEINDVYVCIYNSLWGRGGGRKYALYELSLTNKNNIIMRWSLLTL